MKLIDIEPFKGKLVNITVNYPTDLVEIYTGVIYDITDRGMCYMLVSDPPERTHHVKWLRVSYHRIDHIYEVEHTSYDLRLI